MSRILLFGNVKRATHSLLANRKAGFGEVVNGAYCTDWFHYTTWRLHNCHAHSFRGHSPFLVHKVWHNLLKNNSSRNFLTLSASYAISYNAQVACKRLWQMCMHNGPALPPISRIACAVSVALTRSNLVAPGVIAFIIGELFWAQQTYAEAESSLLGDTFYAQTHNGHIYLTAFVSLALECIILLLRAVYLAILFSPCVAMFPFANSLGPKFRKSWLHVVHLTLEKAGPAFIKWGQWAATRPDLFSQDLCAELSKLHRKAPAHSFSFTKKTVERAFGRKLPEIFSKFEEDPVASGSVAQVHRAILKYRYPGQEIKPVLVAVKVRHPGVGDAIRRDFMLINLISKFSKFIPNLKWSRLDESIQQFAVFMMSQVDLAREAAHLSRFLYNFRRWKDVSFPRPLYPLVHPAVLVETYEQGESVIHYVDGLEGHQRIKASLAHIGTHALLKMLLVDNFVHADMHPGNILVRLADKKMSHKNLFGLRPHVIFLDVGMTAELSHRDRQTLLEFFKAVAVQDGRTAAECTLRLSRQQSCPDPETFIEEVERCFTMWDSPHVKIHPAECMQQMLEHIRHHKVNIDGNVCTVMVTTLVLEGWQRKLDPEYDVLHALQTLLFRASWADSLSYIIDGLMAP